MKDFLKTIEEASPALAGYIHAVFGREPVELYSPLSPEECTTRLNAAMDRPLWRSVSFSQIFGSRPVIGSVDDETVTLRKRIRYRNSFQTFLSAKMEPHGAGTIIRGELAMHPWVRAFIPFWLGGVVLFCVAGVIFTLFSESFLPLLMIPLMCGAMFLFGVAGVYFGRYVARDEAGFLMDFLRQTAGVEEKKISN